MGYPRLVEEMIDSLVRLPGVGRRSAERMVFWLLDHPKDEARLIADGIVRLKEELHFCSECNHLTDRETCSICQDPGRDRLTVCVVESPKDVIAIERTGVFKGLYHVLLGAIAPAEGRGPEDLDIERLIGRVRALGAREIVIATDADTEGEMTALHIIQELRPMGVKLSRIGVGIPMGSSVEYVDHSTLTMSMSARREIPCS